MAGRRDEQEKEKRALLAKSPSPAGTSTALVRRQVEAGPQLRPLPPHFLELNLVWAQLRGNWRWLVVVSADPDESISALASSLAQIGSRLSARNVDFIEATGVDLDSSARLIWHLGTTSNGPSPLRGPADEAQSSTSWVTPVTKTVVALESPLANPLALTVAFAADGVVLCVRKGRTALSSIRATVEAIGADRIIACVMFS